MLNTKLTTSNLLSNKMKINLYMFHLVAKHGIYIYMYMYVVPTLLQYKTGTIRMANFNLNNSDRSQHISKVAVATDQLYSASVDGCETVRCLLDIQDMGLGPRNII